MTGRNPAGASHPSPVSSTSKADRDNDGDHNDDDGHVLWFGHVDKADTQAITVLVQRYFRAAASEDGRQACSMLTPIVAETAVEKSRYSQHPQGNTCAAVMTRLFRHSHRELAAKNARLKVTRVGVEGNRSLVALEFPGMPEARQMTARLDHGRWTILTVLDGIIE